MGKLTRLENWDIKLSEVISSKAEEAYKFGTHDCCISIADCIFAMTGTDPAENFRGYSTKKQVTAFKKKYKQVLGIVQSLTKDFECEMIIPGRAQRGDIALVVDEEIGHVLGIVDLSGRYVLTAAEKGWNYLPVSTIERAWRIG